MKIVGCDFHPSFQQIALLDTVTGEIEERRLVHGNGEAEPYYRQLEAPALIGMEAVGNSLWFEQLMAQLGHELWIGDAAQIRASYVRKQKTDRRDAGHILHLLMEKRFPRIWTPSAEQRDVRQLLLHRHKLVGIRTRVKTELQHLAMNRGLQKQRALWSVRGRACLEKLPLEGWTRQRREDLLAVLSLVESQVEKLDEAVSLIAANDKHARLLMTQPGVGPVTALAFVVTIGDVRRFKRGKHVGSYLGLIPAEHSSGNKRRLGAISKQGNVFLQYTAGRSRAIGMPLRPTVPQRVSTSLSPQAQGSGQGGGGTQAGHKTVLDAPQPNTLCVGGSQRGQLESFSGQPKLGRSSDWAPSHPAKAECSNKRIMADVLGRIDGWWSSS